MLGGNTYLTIWNRFENTFFRYELHKKCRHTLRTTRDRGGVGDTMTSSIISTLVCRIPYIPEYKSPHIWRQLPLVMKCKYFTIQNEDFIAKGIHRYEIRGSTPSSILGAKSFIAPTHALFVPNAIGDTNGAVVIYGGGTYRGDEDNSITIPELRELLGNQVMQVQAVRYSTETQLGRHIRAEGV